MELRDTMLTSTISRQSSLPSELSRVLISRVLRWDFGRTGVSPRGVVHVLPLLEIPHLGAGSCKDGIFCRFLPESPTSTGGMRSWDPWSVSTSRATQVERDVHKAEPPGRARRRGTGTCCCSVLEPTGKNVNDHCGALRRWDPLHSSALTEDCPGCFLCLGKNFCKPFVL